MKVFVCLVIYVAITGALGESEICSSSVTDTCQDFENIISTPPDTVEELKDKCNNLQEIATCHLNYFEKCPEDEKNTPAYINFFEYLQENCQENSHAFQVLSSNLDCFTPKVKTLAKECSEVEMISEDYHNIMKTYRRLFNTNNYNCLDGIWEVTCRSEIMQRLCGSEVGDVFADFLENTNDKYIHYCNKSLSSEVSTIKVLMERIFLIGGWSPNNNEDED